MTSTSKWNFKPRCASALFALLYLAAVNCGPQPQSFDVSNSSASQGQAPTSHLKLVLIPVKLNNQLQKGPLSLVANATSFSISLAGCASGYTSTATDASTNLQAYQYDIGCLAKLTQFAINGNTYSATATGASNFTTWAVNDVAVFANTTNSSDLLNVAVTAQLDNPVAGTEVVSYSFYNIAKGADSIFTKAQVGNGHTMSVSGQAAPNFTLTQARYVGMTNLGQGLFEFTLQCTQALTNSNTTCYDIILTTMDYKLVQDTYGGTLTLANANSIFSTAGTSVASGEVVDVGAADNHSNTLANGGFYTNESSYLTGPTTINSAPNMLLVIRATVSYLYFKVDVTTLTQN